MDYFDIPKKDDHIIKVIGVGGGGSNAVENMLSNDIKDVELIICNTDRQDLDHKSVDKKLLIGSAFNDGEGAGANPDIGAKAAIESKDDLKKYLEGAKMLFITAGMGGGTGTGAAPVIASIARELNILVIGIVTVPFEWEGNVKRKQAMTGVDELNKSCDCVVLIYNDKITELYPDVDLDEAFQCVDDILLTATKGIVEIVSEHRRINVDLKDVYTTMSNSGTALMGISKASGDNKAEVAIKEALQSPLLGIDNVKGAKKALISITVSSNSTFSPKELQIITKYLKEETNGAEIILGWGKVDDLDEDLMVTVIVTGFKNSNLNEKNTNDDTVETDFKQFSSNNPNERLVEKELFSTISEQTNSDIKKDSIENQLESVAEDKKKSEQQTLLFNPIESEKSEKSETVISKTLPSNIPLPDRENELKKLEEERIKREEDAKKGIYNTNKYEPLPKKTTENKEKWANPYQHEIGQNTIDVNGKIRPNSYIYDKPD